MTSSPSTEAIGVLGGLHYFDPDTLATGKEHNLDGFRFYFLGRGGVLGDVEPAVVGSAFGYWNPALIEKMWSSAKERMAPRDAARLYLSCAHELGRKRFGGDRRARRVLRRGRAGQRRHRSGGAGPLRRATGPSRCPTTSPARAMHLCVVLREARGSAHLVGVVAAGSAAAHRPRHQAADRRQAVRLGRRADADRRRAGPLGRGRGAHAAPARAVVRRARRRRPQAAPSAGLDGMSSSASP